MKIPRVAGVFNVDFNQALCIWGGVGEFSEKSILSILFSWELYAVVFQ